jgi:anti-sigma regulatory factor (Ser/Thr protein kinase)
MLSGLRTRRNSPDRTRVRLASRRHRVDNPGARGEGEQAVVQSGEARMVVANRPEELERAALWAADFATGAGVPAEIVSRLQVVLDEAVGNVLAHALADAAPGSREISLRLCREAGGIALEIIDDGAPFDAAAAPVPDVARRVAARRPGGAGLLFLHALADEMRAFREEGRNRLVLVLRVPPAG